MKKNKNCMTTFSNTLEPISLSLNTRTQSLLSLLRARIFQGVTHWESQWCLQELETHTHTQITQHKSSCESESELWLSPQSREPPTAEQSGKKKDDKIDRWNWRKIKMFMVFSPSGLYLWLQIWFISFICLPFLYFLRLLVSQLRHLASPVSNWLLGLLSFSLTLLFSYYSWFSFLSLSSISPALSLSAAVWWKQTET